MVRSLVATALQVAAVVLLLAAGWVWCVPAGLAVTALVVGAAGYAADETR